MLEIIPATSPRLRREFVRCVWSLHRHQPAWVPPLIADQLRMLDPARGEFFRLGNSGGLFLARRGGATVGRIGAFRNETHQRTHHDDVGFFGFFECEADPATARALLHAAEDWLRSAGLRVARGPANFSVQEEAGVLLDGFDLQPMVGMTWTPPYYRSLLESSGYAPCRDLRVYRIGLEGEQPGHAERLQRVAQQVAERTKVCVRPLDPTQLERESRHLAAVFADSWRDNWGHVPILAAEFLELYQRYRLFLVPDLILLAEVDGEPAAAWVTMPDLNVPIKAIDGRLWPFGWWRLLRARKLITRYRAMMFGVRPAFRRMGLPLLFALRCREELRRRGATELEFSWILDDNVEVISSLERFGARHVQTLRLFEKSLA